MSGPEHYRKAEDLLNQAASPNLTTLAKQLLHAEAQVHATLAHAAATAIVPRTHGANCAERKAWETAAHTPETSQ
ncbi:hypothetical protein [Streptomyces sp. NPDC089919]|uniref:hypothetical protein n=1 Tax=Streptomyces sp. NPDC089919 TaxID=3155188 RepID=UPI003446C7D9